MLTHITVKVITVTTTKDRLFRMFGRTTVTPNQRINLTTVMIFLVESMGWNAAEVTKFINFLRISLFNSKGHFRTMAHAEGNFGVILNIVDEYLELRDMQMMTGNRLWLTDLINGCIKESM